LQFIFVPGEKVTGFEDFSKDNIGDFPAGKAKNRRAAFINILLINEITFLFGIDSKMKK
jgi:hypothetical protein